MMLQLTNIRLVLHNRYTLDKEMSMDSKLSVVPIRIDLNSHGANQDVIKFACSAGQVMIHQLCIAWE
jgi:hypothetical protein